MRRWAGRFRQAAPPKSASARRNASQRTSQLQLSLAGGSAVGTASLTIDLTWSVHSSFVGTDGSLVGVTDDVLELRGGMVAWEGSGRPLDDQRP